MIPDQPGLPLGSNPSFFDLVRGLSTEANAAQRTPIDGNPAAVAHGTTVIALKFTDGVVMAGDRRAVEGYTIADEEMNKVFPADDYSAVGIAGVAGQAIEMVKLFQLELEHYEKVEGEHLSLEGKANRLAQMVRASFPMVMQGLVVVPIYAGFDPRRSEGRIYRYDVIGGRYEESDYAATGSGSRDAKASMKKRWRRDLSQSDAIEVAVEALVDAGEEDTATGGPDLIRGIFPTVHVVTTDGVEELGEDTVRQAAQTVIDRRRPA
ncbi:MAG TPA: proteasome subunit beta [Actinomycetota bacterium]|nr:proteasome subunit beta [Actinomycetota bacterium]